MVKRILLLLILPLMLSCGDDDAFESSLDVNLDEQGILSLVNAHRAEGANCNGDAQSSVSSLKWDDALAKAALDHSNDMQKKVYFSHTGQNGSSFSERINDADFEGTPVGENIASGYPNEDAVIQGWMRSEGHCKNIMNGNATHIGIARSDEDALWTMVLGRKTD